MIYQQTKAPQYQKDWHAVTIYICAFSVFSLVFFIFFAFGPFWLGAGREDND